MQKPQKTNPEAIQNLQEENLICCFIRLHHLTSISVMFQISKLDLPKETLPMLVLCSICTLKFSCYQPIFCKTPSSDRMHVIASAALTCLS